MEESNTPSTNSEDKKSLIYNILGKIFKDVPGILNHLVNLVLVLLGIYVLHHLVEYLLGKDPKFFDYIPVKYVFDLADIVMIGKFVWHVIIEIWHTHKNV